MQKRSDMKGKTAKKGFNYVWDIIDVPVFIIVIYSLLELLFQISFYINKLFPSWILSYAITIFAFGMIGYRTINLEKKPVRAARYGAYAGLIAGFIGAIIAIITFYIFPERFVAIIQSAVQQGADPATVQTFMKIGLYAGLIISPAINAGIGALISWLSALIFRKK